MSLITVGTVAFDAIQTPFGSSGKVVGGAASYIGLSASQFVGEQHIISVIGDDFPESFVQEMESEAFALRVWSVVQERRVFIGRANTILT